MRSKWRTKKSTKTTVIISLSLLTLILIFYQQTSTLITKKPHFKKCQKTLINQKFMWFAPHSGFSNQLAELKNAILMAGILNRTLIVPPVLDHHAVALGSCPKFRVSEPGQLRVKVWDHSIDLIKQGRYVSMADIIDISSVSTLVQTIDFRYFISLWCGVDLNSVCSDDSSVQPSVVNSLSQCGSQLSGLSNDAERCVHAVDLDCRTTVWTYQQNDLDNTLDSFQPDEQLRMKKKISYVRLRRDVHKYLGPGSAAHLSTVLAFGTLFTSPYRGSQLYIDIHKSPKDHKIQSLLQKIEFMPFVPDIINVGKEFAQKMNAPFLCAQLRLLDGQFKNHWKSTFLGLKQKVEALKQESKSPIHIFVMTDLPRSNWSGSYLGDLASDANSFKIHALSNEDEHVRRTAEKIALAVWVNEKKWHCPDRLPDMLLYIEEAVCSCASLGFVGTAGSTIAESIEMMRNNGVCSEQK